MVPAMSTQTATGTTKVAVVGAGSVGATCAYACLIQGIGRTIALYDINADKTRAEVLDLNHGLQFVPRPPSSAPTTSRSAGTPTWW